ncbi:hypothetical protein PINS_up008616 [Pythium insidiosum]|nr:hypothetical protein PINS_up008616 [Pythium insidiosum]
MHLCVFDASASSVQELVTRIVAAVDARRSPLDLFSGIEAHVKERLEQRHLALFHRRPEYEQLCQALRSRRELPLGEILVDHRRTRFLEQFVQQTTPDAMGNLLFWIEVQTRFLPLIQTSVFSVTLFEEIQATVRRLYNLFLTENSRISATLIPDAMRKDTLKRIMLLQGEPFSPPRYAGLFRPAQEKIWHWLQTTVYPKFQRSMLYVLLVVEIENMESDQQLRRLSEHVQKVGVNQPKRDEHKLSAIFIPVQWERRRVLDPEIDLTPALSDECGYRRPA